MSKIHLVIPDSHAHPDYSNERFDWIGQLIVDLRPDVIVNLGDQADMPSLCSYDKGTKGFEGRRYRKDIEANDDANQRIFRPLAALQERQTRNKKRMYNPYTVFLLGNHENRINRAIDADAILDGTISTEDLGNEGYWHEVVPFLTPKVIDGIAYCHYFTSGIMGRPISGINPARMLLNKQSMSCTVGHMHTRDFAEASKADGSKILGLVAGVYQDYHADFAGPANDMWWKGVVIKRNVQDGNYDHEWVSLDELRRRYA